MPHSPEAKTRPTAPSRLLEREFTALKLTLRCEIASLGRQNAALLEEVSTLRKRIDAMAKYVDVREDV